MKKLLTLLTLLMCAITGINAQEPDPDYESYNWNSEQAGAQLGTHGDLTIVGNSLGNGNINGTYYLSIKGNLKNSDNPWTNYLGFTSSRKIEKIAIYYCPNGTDKTNIAWVAWGKNVTPNQYTLAHGTTTGTTGSKSLESAVWETIDLNANDVYAVYISRSIREFREIGGSSNLSNFGEGKTINVLGIRVWLEQQKPTIETQPVGAGYISGDPITPLTVSATASAGTLSYQWYKCDDLLKTNAAAISGATSTSYTPSESGFYFVRVTDTNGSIDSDVVQIVISSAAAPSNVVITPNATSVVRGGDAITLTASADGNPIPTYQWYSNTTASNVGGTIIDGETEASFQPAIDAVGKFYYYVVATNASGSDKSAAQLINVLPKAPTIPATGYFAGTKVVEIAKAVGEDASAVIKYKEGTGEWQDYSAALNYTATTTITAKVVQDGLESDEVSATYTQFEKSDLALIAGEKTWNLSTSITIQLNASTYPTKTSEEFFTYSDYAALNDKNLGDLDGTTLAFRGEYPLRGSNGSQNGWWKFTTKYPGTITVEFSNTGSSNKDRYVKVTDSAGSKTGTIEADGTAHQTESFDVEAGDVIITGVKGSTGVEGIGTDAAIRLYNIKFVPALPVTEARWATATTPDYPVSFDAVARVYVVTDATSSITLEQITEAPANTPIIINADKGNYTMTKKASATAIATNLLKSSDGSIVGTGSDIYVLGKRAGVVGFGPLANGTPLPAGKAYIDLGSSAKDFLPFIIDGEENGETDGIDATELQHTQHSAAFNLAGQKVDASYKGIVIVNGKKVKR